MIQLNPPLPLVTPKGEGLAHFVINDGPEHHLVWIVFQKDGEIWAWENPHVRAAPNLTYGRPSPDKPDKRSTYPLGSLGNPYPALPDQQRVDEMTQAGRRRYKTGEIFTEKP